MAARSTHGVKVGQVAAAAAMASVLATIGLWQPPATSRGAAIALVTLGAVTVLLLPLTSGKVMRAVVGPVTAAAIGLLIFVTGGAESHYQDAALAMPAIGALVLSGRDVVKAQILGLLVVATPVLYDDVGAGWLTDYAADAIVWSGIVAVVYTQTARLKQQRARLQAADELKTAFLRATSHELRTPLTVVRGNAETLLRNGERLDPHTRQDLVRSMHRHATRLDRLLTDLLDVDRLRVGAVVARREPLDLADAARRVLAHLDLADHRLEVDLAPAPMLGDEAKLERVIENLLANAARHGGHGSRIRLAVGVHGGRVVMTVEDDGPGVPAEDRERIFEPFHQGSVARRSHAPGTGIGLSLVALVTEMHDGEITIEDSALGGARFVVRFPTFATAVLPAPLELWPEPRAQP